MIIEIDNKKIFYKYCNEQKITSESMLLVFLHEGLGSVEQWKDFPEKVSTLTNLPALLYDRYGYGHSSELKEQRDIWYLHKEAEFLECLLNSLSINQKIILVGHSDGGTIALLYAAMYPEKVEALITIAHHVFVEEVSIKGVQQAVWAYKNTDMKKRLEKYHPNKVDSMFYGWANVWTNHENLKYTIVDELSKIKIPILTFQGENDQYGTYAQLKAIEENCKNPLNEIHWLSECGHAPQKDKEEYLIERISDFLKKI